jgi:phosphate transport system substrate-binding protein
VKVPVNRSAGFFLPFILLAGGLSSCGGAGGPTATPRLTLAAPSSLERIAEAFVEEYNQANPQGLPWEVRVIYGDEGIPPSDQPGASAVLQWRDPPPGDWSALVGWMGILFAVSRDNPITDVSSADVFRIYAGRIDRWESVGGRAGGIRVLAFEADGAGWEEMLEAAVLRGERLIPGAVVVPSCEAMAAAVAGDDRSIGFLPGFQSPAGIRVLTIDSVVADYPNVLSGKYPFRVPLYLTAEPEAPAEVLAFAGWLQSVAGQTILVDLQKRE